jgi:HD-GYP domain-containing protein (c-di-GMP phosphodiesterase class II)
MNGTHKLGRPRSPNAPREEPDARLLQVRFEPGLDLVELDQVEPRQPLIDLVAQRQRPLSVPARRESAGAHRPKVSLAARVWDALQGGNRLEEATRALADLQLAYDETLTALAGALELRDDESGSHTVRVTELATSLTEAVDLELAREPGLRYGFLLHDIGKIGIPERILLKHDALTEREREQVQLHPTLGESLARAIPSMAGVARDVISYHHEHFDGNGYPWGLRGEDIPLAARIFAVCDAYDAMTTDRPYRQAMASQDALAELRKRAGSQFDPEVAETFIEMIERRTLAAGATQR